MQYLYCEANLYLETREVLLVGDVLANHVLAQVRILAQEVGNLNQIIYKRKFKIMLHYLGNRKPLTNK